MKIKICGLREARNIEDVVGLEPDYIGFIFYDKSPRCASELLIPAQLYNLGYSVKKIGVFVNANLKDIAEIRSKFALDGVQLHGDETAAYCEDLNKSVPGLEIIKAFGVDDGFDFSIVTPYEKSVSHFLFDTKSDEYGGTGRAFDWNILLGYSGNLDFFVAGGLNRSNLSEVIEVLAASDKFYGLDFNSGVEMRPGVKSIGLVQDVISKVRGR